MSLSVGTGKAEEANGLMEAFARGRNDPVFFCDFFMGRKLHDGQAEFMVNSQAKVNYLATANRWGKTTILTGLHSHAGTYKTGAEFRYVDDEGNVNRDAFTKLKYETVHTAGEWEQARFVWDDFQKIVQENRRYAALIKDFPRSLPPHATGSFGWRWLFRTLGNNASNIDGKSIYVLSIDEAGWIDNLEEMMRNVLRVRTADVYGRIVCVGTFKPGISRDFYKGCVRASAHTGRRIDFAHGSDAEDADAPETLDQAIAQYVKEFGINLDEYADAVTRGARP